MKRRIVTILVFLLLALIAAFGIGIGLHVATEKASRNDMLLEERFLFGNGHSFVMTRTENGWDLNAWAGEGFLVFYNGIVWEPNGLPVPTRKWTIRTLFIVGDIAGEVPPDTLRPQLAAILDAHGYPQADVEAARLPDVVHSVTVWVNVFANGVLALLPVAMVWVALLLSRSRKRRKGEVARRSGRWRSLAGTTVALLILGVLITVVIAWIEAWSHYRRFILDRGWGWPFDAFVREPNVNPELVWADMPHLPIWPGLIADTAFYGSAVWLSVCGLGAALRWFVWTERSVRGRCPTCSYDLRADLEHGCPECGWNRDTDRTEAEADAEASSS